MRTQTPEPWSLHFEILMGTTSTSVRLARPDYAFEPVPDCSAVFGGWRHRGAAQRGR